MYIPVNASVFFQTGNMRCNLKNDEKRKAFGEFLKELFLRYHFKQTGIASHLKISRQRIGLVCAGKTPLPDRLFNMIHDLLDESGAKEKDLKELSRLFVESKVSIPGSMLVNPDELFKTATELKDYMDLEKALAKSLDIASHEQNYDNIMNKLVEVVGTRTGSHFCAIYLYENNYSRARMVYEWHSANYSYDLDRIRTVPASPQSEWLQQFSKKRVVNIFNPGRTHFVMPHPILDSEIKALLCSGIWLNRQISGVMVASNIKHIRKYSEIEERLIRKVCTIVQLVMERRQFYTDTRFSDTLCRPNFVFAPPAMMFNPGRELCSMTKSCCELLNLSEEEAVTGRIWERICAENPEVSSPLDSCLREKVPVNVPMKYNHHRYMMSALPFFDRFGNIQYVAIACFEMLEKKD